MEFLVLLVLWLIYRSRKAKRSDSEDGRLFTHPVGNATGCAKDLKDLSTMKTILALIVVVRLVGSRSAFMHACRKHT